MSKEPIRIWDPKEAPFALRALTEELCLTFIAELPPGYNEYDESLMPTTVDWREFYPHPDEQKATAGWKIVIGIYA